MHPLPKFGGDQKLKRKSFVEDQKILVLEGGQFFQRGVREFLEKMRKNAYSQYKE